MCTGHIILITVADIQTQYSVSLLSLLFALLCTDGEAAGIAIAVIFFVGLVIYAIRVAIGVVLVQRQKYKGRSCKHSCMHTTLYCTSPYVYVCIYICIYMACAGKLCTTLNAPTHPSASSFQNTRIVIENCSSNVRSYSLVNLPEPDCCTRTVLSSPGDSHPALLTANR